MSRESIQIALLGNPNIGKSSLFNRLTGLAQKVGNFAGVTIEKKSGSFMVDAVRFEITDLPGTYSLLPKSPDEVVVFQHLFDKQNADGIALVLADASNLARNLLLFSQLADLKIPSVLAVNMIDVGETRGIQVDYKKLEKEIGCPVVPINARTGLGIPELKQRLIAAKVPDLQLFDLKKSLGISAPETITYKEWLQWAGQSKLREQKLCDYIPVLNKLGIEPALAQAKETVFRHKALLLLESKVIRQTHRPDEIGFRFDAIAMHPVWGYVLMLGILLIIFQAIFKLAQIPMQAIEAGMGYLRGLGSSMLPEGILKKLFLEGILSGIEGVIIFVPQIAILFGLIGLLEESGYMARVMVLLDSGMKKLGLSGRAVVPLVSGVACAVPAIMSTRSMSSSRERLIAIFITPMMSCSARLPVFSLLIAMLVPAGLSWGPFSMQGLTLFGLYLIGLLGAIATAFAMDRWLMKGGKSSFVLEIPPYQVPHWRNVWISVYQKSSAFVLEAGKVILAISVILWVMASFGPGNSIENAAAEAAVEARALALGTQETDNLIASRQLEVSYAGIAGQWIEPAIQPLGFDWKIGVALITSFAAREVFVGTMSVLYAAGSDEETSLLQQRMQQARNPQTGLPVFTGATIASLLVFYIFAMQCMSTLAVSYRETGSWKWPTLQLVYMTGLAFLASLLVYQIFSV